jgi:hypothetical protein
MPSAQLQMMGKDSRLNGWLIMMIAKYLTTSTREYLCIFLDILISMVKSHISLISENLQLYKDRVLAPQWFKKIISLMIFC